MDGLFYFAVGKMKNLNKKSCTNKKFFLPFGPLYFSLYFVIKFCISNFLLGRLLLATHVWRNNATLWWFTIWAEGYIRNWITEMTTRNIAGVTLASDQSHAWIFRLLLKISVERGKIMSLKPTFFGLLCLLDQEVYFICYMTSPRTRRRDDLPTPRGDLYKKFLKRIKLTN